MSSATPARRSFKSRNPGATRRISHGEGHDQDRNPQPLTTCPNSISKPPSAASAPPSSAMCRASTSATSRSASTEIADQLWNASTEIGFFQLVNHGIPQAQIDEAFEMTARFFDLPHDVKAKMPLLKGTNSGWEYKSQVRPSTGTADNKESYQITVAAHGEAVAGRRKPAGLSRHHAGVRTRQLGARHEGAVLLRTQARLRAGFLHRCA